MTLNRRSGSQGHSVNFCCMNSFISTIQPTKSELSLEVTPRSPAVTRIDTRQIICEFLSVPCMCASAILLLRWCGSCPRVARFPKPKYGRFFHYSRHRRRSSVNFGGRHFCRKIYALKINKMPEFYDFFPKNIFPQFWGQVPLPPVSYAYDSRHAAFCQLSSSPATFTDLRIQSNRR